ncbi:MAG TPA: hypothetical protein VKU81_00240, partial [Casimicrobiaceae bacterium]|nr:hypothetical protein [Casimicrobiaceae bacterium]
MPGEFARARKRRCRRVSWQQSRPLKRTRQAIDNNEVDSTAAGGNRASDRRFLVAVATSMWSKTLGRAALAAIAAVTIAALSPAARANGSDLPPQVVLQGFVKPVDGRLQLLVRIPLVFIQPFAVPKRGPGYLDLTRIDNVLQQAATAASRQITLFEDGARLVPTVRQARISVLSDRSFRDHATALAHLEGPPLAPDTDLFWNQGFFDTEIDYPIRSPNDHFSVSVNVMPDLGSRVRLQLQFLPVGASPRNFELTGGSTSVALDP